MATNVSKVQINAVDNELYIIASQPVGSHQLFHNQSGFNAPVSYAFDPHSILAKGDYDLTFVGINWGGPWSFNIATTPPTGLAPASGSGGAGVVWSKTVQITV
jgi:hypothetical protein